MSLAWRNTQQRYGLIAMALHWLIAVGIVTMVPLGLYMHELEGSDLKFALYQWHKSIGITILLLSLLRLAWRLANPIPPPPAHMRAWERAAAVATHWGFYALMIGIPLSGWAMVSASPWGIPTVLYGVIEWPHIAPLANAENKKALEGSLKEVHEILAFAAIGLFILHVGAALRHAITLKDGVLARMTPFHQPRSPE